MQVFKVKYFVYNAGDISETVMCKNNLETCYEYAEDLLVDIAKRVKIGPIARFLFGLRLESSHIWLALNQRLDELTEPHQRNFLFRVRFRPNNLELLQVTVIFYLLN
jgi:hypothetical protein